MSIEISVDLVKKIANRIQKNQKNEDSSSKLKLALLHTAICQALGYRDYFHFKKEMEASDKNKVNEKVSDSSAEIGVNVEGKSEEKSIKEKADEYFERILVALNKRYPGLDLVFVESIAMDIDYCEDIQSLTEEIDETYDEYGRVSDEIIDKHVEVITAPPGYCYYKARDKNKKAYLLLLNRSETGQK